MAGVSVKYLFLALVIPSAAFCEVYNGNELHQLCLQDRAHQYIAGHIDKAEQDAVGMLILSADAKGDMVETVRKIVKGYCLPPKATLGQATDVVCKYIKENPKDRTKPATVMVGLALNEAFPCSK